jgi:hypothetical protein
LTFGTFAEIFKAWLDRASADFTFLVVLTVVSGLYGGLHLLTWHAPLATENQKTLWRISGVVILAPFSVLLFAIPAALALPICLQGMSYWLVWSKVRRTIKSIFKPKGEEYPLPYLRDIMVTVGAVAAAVTKRSLSLAY